jgi:tight adherence protein B
MTGQTALAVLLGTGAGMGLVLAALGLRSRARPYRRPGRVGWRRGRDRGTVRLAVACGCAVAVAAVTRWPVGAALAALGAWWLPGLLGTDRHHAKRVARIEAIASWTESLRDTLAGAAGLEQTILVTAPVAPAPIAADVAVLAGGIQRGERLPAALRDLAGRLADPTADLVVGALVLAAEQQARDLGSLLGRLAAAAREQAAMRMRIAAARARIRSSVRIIVAATAALTAALVVWSRPYLRPYDSLSGQVVLLVIGACFAAAFTWLDRIARVDDPPRVLTGPGGHGGPGGRGTA